MYPAASPKGFQGNLDGLKNGLRKLALLDIPEPHGEQVGERRRQESVRNQAAMAPPAMGGSPHRGVVESKRAPPSWHVPPDCKGTHTFTLPVHDAPAGSVASKER